jgi:hypothetical protein
MNESPGFLKPFFKTIIAYLQVVRQGKKSCRTRDLIHNRPKHAVEKRG